MESRSPRPEARSHQLGQAYAEAADRRDPLHRFRQRFYLPHGRIYLDGNSLGLASREAEAAMLAALEAWKAYAIDGWTSGSRPWFHLGEELGAMQAELVGADPAEVVVAASTSVNLHALAATFYRPSGARTKIVSAAPDFPTVLYALQSQLRLHGLDPSEHLTLVQARDGGLLDEADLIEAMSDQVALVVVSSVLYRSGQLLDLERLTRAAHERGIPIGFDCSHSVGCVPHRLHDWQADFACWCNYKYANGGPGALASLFVHRRHFGAMPGLAGWWGSNKERQFDMSTEFQPADGAGAWQIGTPSVLGAAALYGALQLFREARIERVREKSLDLTAYLMFLVDRLLSQPPYGFSIGTPRESTRRGGHVALEHPDAVRISKALKAHRVIGDFRAPNVIRLAPAALYNSYVDVWRTVEILKGIVDAGEHERFKPERDSVA